jgi:excisionase family DNA binding protein
VTTTVAVDGSAVVGSHAVVSGRAAVALVRLLGSWERSFHGLRLPAEAFDVTGEAVAALRAAAAAASECGSAEVERKSTSPKIDAWMTTKEVAEATGLSDRWIRELAASARIDGSRVGRGLLFPPETPARVLALGHRNGLE